MVELHISPRLKRLLPLSDDEKKRLEARLISDGKVYDPILYWFDGTRYVILDGMEHYEIATRLNLPYKVTAVKIEGNYDDAEVWILERLVGKLVSNDRKRLIIGKLYNRVKRPRGGQRKESHHG